MIKATIYQEILGHSYSKRDTFKLVKPKYTEENMKLGMHPLLEYMLHKKNIFRSLQVDRHSSNPLKCELQRCSKQP